MLRPAQPRELRRRVDSDGVVGAAGGGVAVAMAGATANGIKGVLARGTSGMVAGMVAGVVAAVEAAVVLGALAAAPLPASATVPATAASRADATAQPPAEVASALPGARLVGQGTLRWFGLAVYEARLWAPDGFDGQRFESHPFALELRYLRRLDGSAISERALDEMRRTGPIAETEAAAWRAAMRAAFPDVGPGDRLTGVHDPARGTRFHFNGRVTGVLADSVFARRFYAVWLGAQTSQPALRAQLLGAAR